MSADPIQMPLTGSAPERPSAAAAPHLPITVPPVAAGYQPAAQPVLGAERSPGVVALLSIVTLGIYLIFWWYQVNREMRDFARTMQPTHPLAGASPGTSTLAVTLGVLLIVPVFVTAHSTARRVGDAMTLSGLPPHDRPSPGLFMCMYTIGGLLIVPPFFYAPLLQGRLNRAWQHARAAQQQQSGDWLAAVTAA